jgi:hypothetical protein
MLHVRKCEESSILIESTPCSLFSPTFLGQNPCYPTNDLQHSTSNSESHNVDSEDRPYDCPFCSKRFGRSDVRNHHARSIHDEGGDQDFLRSAGKPPSRAQTPHEKAGTASPVNWGKQMWVMTEFDRPDSALH